MSSPRKWIHDISTGKLTLFVSKKQGTRKRRVGKRRVTTPRVGSAQWMINGGYIGVETRKGKGKKR